MSEYCSFCMCGCELCSIVVVVVRVILSKQVYAIGGPAGCSAVPVQISKLLPS